MRFRRVAASFVPCFLAVAPAFAQSFDAVGTRAAGMGGAFVAVADDASAVYWNPAGLAAGAFFSAVLDRLASEARPEDSTVAGAQSSVLFSLTMPALGLSYYRLRATGISQGPTIGGWPGVENLVTHHGGVTLVQSVAPGLAVGATLKLVRGVAGTEVMIGQSRDGALDAGADILGRASNAFDADIGVMLTAGRLRAGLTVRNLFEPSFDAAGGGTLSLDRQARVGIAWTVADGWLVASDADLLRARDAVGYDRRHLAVGTEGRLGGRAVVRAGTRLDTAGKGPGGRAATVSVGGSYAVLGSLWLDGAGTLGSRWGGRGWGLAARFVY